MQNVLFQPAHAGMARELKEFWRGFFAHVGEHFVPHHKNNYHPHIFSHRMTALLSALLVCVKLFTVAAISMGPVLPAFSSELTPGNIISLTNESRQAFNLKILSQSEKLGQAAQAKAEDMLKNQYFAHNSPQGKAPWDFIHTVGYEYLVAGENLAVNFTDAESVKQAWMNSPSHKANLLNKNYKEIGIGISRGEYQGRQATFVVQMFGDPSEQKVRLTTLPTQVQVKQLPKPAEIFISKGLGVVEASVQPDGELMKVSAKIEGDAVKVLARYGQRAIMLDPGKDGLWSGYVAAGKLSESGVQLEIIAMDIFGDNKNFKVAYFSQGIQENYNVLGITKNQAEVKLFGINFTPKQTESKFYLWFAVVMLSSLVIAIAVRHRIQHTSLVMNGSLVVVLAMLFWMAG